MLPGTKKAKVFTRIILTPQSAKSLQNVLSRTIEKFETAFIGIVNMADGTMETINAGHNEPLLLRSTGNVEKLYEGGFILGMFDFATYTSQTTTLLPSDFVYLYTDGISEAFSPEGEEFGTERLEQIVKSKAGKPPRELLEEIEGVDSDLAQAIYDRVMVEIESSE